MKQSLRIFLTLLGVLALITALTTIFGNKPLAAKETFMVPMRDGVKLATDVYLPENDSKLPVLLVRTPYNKNVNADFGNSILAAGIILVAQDTRGRYASGGANIPFDGDGWWGASDGTDTVNWILKQSWCNGKIATFGGSALGIAQLMLAGSGTDNITFQHISVGCPGLYLDGLTHGGVLRKAVIYDWVSDAQFSEDTLSLWFKHPLYDEYWQKRDLRTRFEHANSPAMHIGGWYDIFAQGSIDAFVGMQNKGGPKARGNQKLLMGPWTHAVGVQPAGELTFPNGTESPNKVEDLGLWALQYMMGQDSGIKDLPNVTYYVMGDTKDPNAPGNEWRFADTWPPVKSVRTPFYFTSDNKLTQTKPKNIGRINYISDPSHPIPSIGGPQLTLPAGPRDQQTIESRNDLVLFTSEPLKTPLEITGKVNLRLWASTDVPDTDFIARLCVVYPDGTSYNICEGALRAGLRESPSKLSKIEPGKPYLYNIDLWSTSFIVNKGLKIRVHIAGSSYPAFQTNKNNGSSFGGGFDVNVAHNTILTGANYPSAIILPVVW